MKKEQNSQKIDKNQDKLMLMLFLFLFFCLKIHNSDRYNYCITLISCIIRSTRKIQIHVNVCHFIKLMDFYPRAVHMTTIYTYQCFFFFLSVFIYLIYFGNDDFSKRQKSKVLSFCKIQIKKWKAEKRDQITIKFRVYLKVVQEHYKYFQLNLNKTEKLHF